jgi:fibro-slime domain-containing protein
MKTLRLKVSLAVGIALTMACAAFGQSQSGDFPDIVVVGAKKDSTDRITFYDFRSDRSNPEFEVPHGTNGSDANQQSYYEEWSSNNGGSIVERTATAHIRRNMVARYLDKDGKPQLGTKPYLNHGIRFWFRDWSKLSTYTEADSNVTVGGVQRKYLDKFRPIYTYANNNVLPPGLEQGAGSIDGGEWSARPNTDGNTPYAYLNMTNVTVGGQNYTISTSYAGGGVKMGNYDYTIANAYENKVFDSTLTFTHIYNRTNNPRDLGVYEYDNKRFFPLDGKGFESIVASGGNGHLVNANNTIAQGRIAGRDWAENGKPGDRNNPVSAHNFSYTMELSWEFTMRDNLTFAFRGDDDVWVFINGQLVSAFDLGGIHNPFTDSLNLENLRSSHGLSNGNKYIMKMFYCERHSNGSSIRMRTNLFAPTPTRMDLNVRTTTLTAGDSIPVMGCVGMDDMSRIDDQKGCLDSKYNDNKFVWRARDTRDNSYGPPSGEYTRAGNVRISPPKPSQTLANSDTVYLYAEKAYTYIMLYGEYDGKVRDSVRVYVQPGPATHLYVENSPDSAGKLWAPVPLDTIRIRAIASSERGFYAVLRDRFGNWVGLATHPGRGTIIWRADKPGIATVDSTGVVPARGEGRATRAPGVGTGSTDIFVSFRLMTGGRDTTLSGKSIVKLDDYNYTSIRIGVKNGGVSGTFIDLSGGVVNMDIPSDTTLYVQGQRSSDGVWEDALVNWKDSLFIAKTHQLPTSPAFSWKYTAESPQSGARIIVTDPNNPNTPSGTTFVIINATYRDVAVMRFYNISDTVSFGNPVTEYPQPKNETRKIWPYAEPALEVNVNAGVDMPIVAAMFATNAPALNNYLKTSSLPSGWSIGWSFVGNQPAGTTITKNSADSATFRSTVAHQTYTVRATYTATGKATVTQDIIIRVHPGYPTALYIEPDNNGLAASPNKVRPSTSKTDTVYIIDPALSIWQYAVLRDEWENYVAASNGPTSWGASDSTKEWWKYPHTTISAEGGYAPWGEGIVSRPDTLSGGTTKLLAYDSTYFVTGWINVKVRLYAYDSLRIVDKNRKPVGKIEFTTNDDTTFYVQGRIYGCIDTAPNPETCWELVPARWGTDDSLTNVLENPPGNSDNWTLSPIIPGEGKITVSIDGVRHDGTSDKISVEVPAIIKLGPPTEAVLVILTPPDQIKAGDTIRAEIQYFNNDGRMTRWDADWPNPGAAFVDNKDKGTDNMPIPKVFSSTGENNLFVDGKVIGFNAVLDHETGTAKVSFILYNAGVNPHTITYTETIAGSPLTSSADLNLLPGNPDRVIITVDGADKGDSISLTHGEKVILVTVGEDKYGNKTGEERSIWCIEGGIPTSYATCDNPTTLIPYETIDATANGCGIITATPSDPNVKGDELKICIIGVSLKPTAAFTRDYHGCGYINAVELTFATEIKLFEPFNNTTSNNKINLFHENYGKFTVDSIKIKGNIVTLFVVENYKPNLQTDWTLKLKIDKDLLINANATSGTTDVADVIFENWVVSDGVAPVISTAKRFFDKGGDKKRDYIEVTFSETVYSTSKGAFIAGAHDFKPNQLFRIWALEENSSMSKVRTKKLSKSAKTSDVETKRFSLVEAALAGIESMEYESNGQKFRFYLSNEFDIKPPSHYINIVVDPTKSTNTRSEIRDGQTTANVPDTNNRRVAIVYGNEPPEKLIPVPNPASPDRGRVGNSDQAKNPTTGRQASTDEAHKYIGAYDNYGAIQHIKEGGGGAVFQVPIYVAKDPTTGKADKIRCQVKVYDLAGNLVSSGEEKDVLGVSGSRVTSSNAGDHMTMDLFWSGYNSKGMKSAPGTYRIIVAISYPGSNDTKAKSKKFQGTVGIAK